MSLDKLPRVSLATLPTPLQELPHLSNVLGGPRIFIKRDDLTGIVQGGNKIRKLEYVMADAKQQGADVIITCGGSQSNHACQAGACAKKLGMDTILVLYRHLHPENQGNVFLNTVFGSQMEFVGNGLEDFPLVVQRMKELAEELRIQGRHPYIIEGGAFQPLGTAGYVNAVAEICQQLKVQGLKADHLFTTVGTGGTMAGIVLGAKYFHAPFQVHGVSISGQPDELPVAISRQINDTATLIGSDIRCAPEELDILYDYIGEAYGVPTNAGNEAIELVARTEGILLDPVYTGKCMAGLIDLIRKGTFSKEENVIFMHTGGTSSLFAYTKELSN